jgi:hypothetical protein
MEIGKISSVMLFFSIKITLRVYGKRTTFLMPLSPFFHFNMCSHIKRILKLILKEKKGLSLSFIGTFHLSFSFSLFLFLMIMCRCSFRFSVDILIHIELGSKKKRRREKRRQTFIHMFLFGE